MVWPSVPARASNACRSSRSAGPACRRGAQSVGDGAAAAKSGCSATTGAPAKAARPPRSAKLSAGAPSASSTAWPCSATWKYVTRSIDASRRIVAPLTRRRAGISACWRYSAWSGETSRSRHGMPLASAPRRMRMGAAASWLRCRDRSIVRRPTHSTSRGAPPSVITQAPGARSSTGTSPLSVRMRVPRTKHTGPPRPTDPPTPRDIVAPSRLTRKRCHGSRRCRHPVWSRNLDKRWFERNRCGAAVRGAFTACQLRSMRERL